MKNSTPNSDAPVPVTRSILRKNMSFFPVQGQITIKGTHGAYISRIFKQIFSACHLIIFGLFAALAHFTEFSLNTKLKAGSTEAYEYLFTIYYAPLCVIAKKIVGDGEKARDIVQDVFVTLYAQRADLDIHTSIKSYLFRCVNNACLNELRQSKLHKHRHQELGMERERALSHDEIIYAELQGRIRLTVGNLPVQCRKIFELSRFEGQKNSEIASHLGISIRTVETQISKALRILRSHLSDYLPMIILSSFL